MQDVAFSVGQFGQGLGAGAGLRAAEVSEHPFGNAGPEDRFAAGHRANRPDDVLGACSLEQVASGGPAASAVLPGMLR